MEASLEAQQAVNASVVERQVFDVSSGRARGSIQMGGSWGGGGRSGDASQAGSALADPKAESLGAARPGWAGRSPSLLLRRRRRGHRLPHPATACIGRPTCCPQATGCSVCGTHTSSSFRSVPSSGSRLCNSCHCKSYRLKRKAAGLTNEGALARLRAKQAKQAAAGRGKGSAPGAASKPSTTLAAYAAQQAGASPAGEPRWWQPDSPPTPQLAQQLVRAALSWASACWGRGWDHVMF